MKGLSANGTVGKNARFSIIPRDAIGNLLSSYPEGIFTISTTSNSSNITQSWVNNTIFVNITFSQGGNNRVNIFAYGDVAISGSPFIVQVGNTSMFVFYNF